MDAYSCAMMYMIPFLGSEAVFPKFAPPSAPGIMIVSYLSEGGTYKPDRAISILLSQRCFTLSGKYGFKVSFVTSCLVKLGREDIGCVGHDSSPGISLAGNGFSSIGNIGSPVTLSNTNTKPLLVATATAGILLPFRLTFRS